MDFLPFSGTNWWRHPPESGVDEKVVIHRVKIANARMLKSVWSGNSDTVPPDRELGATM